MTNWRFPYHTEEEAMKQLKYAEKETGTKCFVRQISANAYLFKIFTSENEFNEYKSKSLNGQNRQ